MADRTSAEIFGRIFDMLAELPSQHNIETAAKIYNMAKDYDFNEYQMEADDSLIKLGLAWHEGDKIIYQQNF